MSFAFWAMAWNGFREARRNRVTVVVAIFAVALLLFSVLATETTVVTFDRVMTDVGLGSMTFILVFLAIFLSSGLLSREIERRTIFMVVSKPIPRSLFLTARLTGNMITLTALLIAMSGLFLAELVVFGMPVTGTQLLAMGMLWFELLFLTSLGFFFSSFTTPIPATVGTIGLYFAGHLSKEIYISVWNSKSALVRFFGKGLYYVLPNLERVNFRLNATYNVMPDVADWLMGAGYITAYAAALVGIAIAAFQRRDFR